MFVARSIAADHRDLIHDVSFDFHGRRMATCSSDQSVKVRGRDGGEAVAGFLGSLPRFSASIQPIQNSVSKS